MAVKLTQKAKSSRKHPSLVKKVSQKLTIPAKTTVFKVTQQTSSTTSLIIIITTTTIIMLQLVKFRISLKTSTSLLNTTTSQQMLRKKSPHLISQTSNHFKSKDHSLSSPTNHALTKNLLRCQICRELNQLCQPLNKKLVRTAMITLSIIRLTQSMTVVSKSQEGQWVSTRGK